ncbi:MAG: hypothetical protein ACLFN5_01175 [bacterium]
MLKRYAFAILVAVFSASLLAGCFGGGLPSWVQSPPEEDNVIYAAGEGDSRDRQAARRDAEMDATANLGAILKRDIIRETKNKLERERGVDVSEEELERSASETLEELVYVQLRGAKRDRYESIYNEETGVYTAFVLMKLPFEDYVSFLNTQMEEVMEEAPIPGEEE